jgi:hypothetical protein
MKISNYQTLISCLPVRQQCFTTKRNTWLKAEREIIWLEDLNKSLFEERKTLTISRQDIFNTNDSIRETIVKTIYWGYTGGMRGNHFINILKNIPLLESTFKELKSKSQLINNDFEEMTRVFKNIPGLGLSTYSKLLYFLNVRFNNNPALILDQRLIDVFANKYYEDYSELVRINYGNAEKKYMEYLKISNKIAIELNTQGENIEQFLFIFGNNLKVPAPTIIAY